MVDRRGASRTRRSRGGCARRACGASRSGSHHSWSRIVNGAEPLERIGLRVDGRADVVVRLADGLLEQGEHELVLAVEVLVEAAQRLLRAVDDLLDRELGRALLVDQLERGVEEALHALLGAGAGRVEAAGNRAFAPGRLVRVGLGVDSCHVSTVLSLGDRNGGGPAGEYRSHPWELPSALVARRRSRATRSKVLMSVFSWLNNDVLRPGKVAMELKAGARLRSTTDTTEVVVVKAPAEPRRPALRRRADGSRSTAERGADRPIGGRLRRGQPARQAVRGRRDRDRDACAPRPGPGVALVRATTRLYLKGAKPLPSSD